MNEKNQKIVSKVINRLLSKMYPKDLLNSLMMLEEYTLHKEIYLKEELVICMPFLKGLEYGFKEIRTLRKDIRQELVKQINARVDIEESNYYDIGMLILALQRVSHNSEGMKELCTKSEKIQYCISFIETMKGICGDDKIFKVAMKTLKTIY